jgi:hypothetical protein
MCHELITRHRFDAVCPIYYIRFLFAFNHDRQCSLQLNRAHKYVPESFAGQNVG